MASDPFGKKNAKNKNIPDDPFEDPGSGDWLDKQTMHRLKDSLWLVQVLEFEKHIPTEHSKKDEDTPAIRANVFVLDGEGEGETYKEALIFGRSMVPQLKRKLGKIIVGRITQGTAKGSNNPPWILEKADEDDKNIARDWLKDHRDELDEFDSA
jgi:hypothetical protein